ncbi:MAG TPA: ChaN family lipoprotein [Burkholderiaceae bacterium]|nr:ChaN family lipoprotein [Burkholderiaceae bacterium]
MIGAQRACRVLALAMLCALAACAHPGAAPEATAARLSAALRARPNVLLGEVHDNAAQHALRASALRALLESGARPALLMEQFDRERQADLDRALAQPGVDADAVIDAAGARPGRGGPGWDWSLYRPYVALAVEYRLRVVAANVSRADTRRVVGEGLQAMGFAPEVPGDVRAALARSIVDSHCGVLSAADADRLVAAQVARDQFMARMVVAAGMQGAVLLAGNGHVRSDLGVPRWLPAAARERTASIGLLELGGNDDGRYDIAMTTSAQTRADPCEAFRGGAR